MKPVRIPSRWAFPAVLAIILIVVVLAWREYKSLARSYKEIVAAGATMPDADAQQNVFFDAYHNAVALNFRDALQRGEIPVFYCNDSVMGGQGDAEPRDTIAEMLGRLTGLAIYPVSGAGYTAVLFREYAALVAKAQKKPRLAILSINLRGFSDDWLFTPRWEYAAATAYLRLLADPPSPADLPSWIASGQWDPAAYWQRRTVRPAPSYDALFEKLNADREALLAAPPPGLSPEEQDRRRHFIENYMTHVTPEHPMLGYLLDTAHRLERAGVAVLFYLTPIDIEGGRQLVGEALPANVAANGRVIVESLARSGASCLDLTTLLPEERFVDREYACEHLDLAGRRRVAEALAETLKSLDAAATRPVAPGAAAN
jgi:hypothetical protein